LSWLKLLINRYCCF